MVDALVLGTSGAIHGGSSPLPPTKNYETIFGEARQKSETFGGPQELFLKLFLFCGDTGFSDKI